MVFPVPATGGTAPLQQVGRFSANPAVLTAMQNASAGSNAKFDQLVAYASMESGLNPNARASGSSASGLYQFTQQTWLNAVRQYGADHGLSTEAAAVTQQGGQLVVADPVMRQRILDLRNDPQASSEMAAEHLRGLAQRLTPVLGRTPDAAEVYLGHFLGAGGATQALQALQAAPNQPAANVFPEAAQANRPLFYGSDGSPLTMNEFMQNIRNRVQNTYASIGATMPPSVTTGTTTGPKSDPLEAGASGWGNTTPTHIASQQQQAMFATLAEVFTRMDHSNLNRSRRQQGLPEAVLAPLGSST